MFTRPSPRRAAGAAVLAVALCSVAPAADFDDWVKTTNALKPNDQTDAVRAKLWELNPKFGAKMEGVRGTAENGVVRSVSFESTYLTDLRPVRGFPDLEHLDCASSFSLVSELKDISPLKGMKLKSLSIHHTSVADISVLKGMPLESINLQVTKVRDLSPLKDAPLTVVSLPPWIGAKDAMFLKARPLTYFAADRLDDTGTVFLSRDLGIMLGGSKKSLDHFQIAFSPVTDLTFLSDTPVRTVDVRWCSSIPSLEPLKKCAKLEALSIHSVRAQNLSLAPLKGKPLTEFMAFECPGVRDLSPLAGMKTLKHLGINATSVTDLAPIAKCENLEAVYIEKLPLKSLKPLAGLSKLKRIDLRETVVADRDFTPLAKLPLELVSIDVDAKTGKPLNPALAKVLKTVPTLKRINDLPAAEVLK